MLEAQTLALAKQEPQVSETTVQELAAQLTGELLRPGDGGYDRARSIWNGMIDKHPAFIIRCHGVADVIDAVNFAREHNLLTAVHSAGHNVSGTAVCDGGVMIDLSPMKGIRVDPLNRTARAEPGVVWGELDRETQQFGYAVCGGVVSTTGIAGLTLGGGYSWMRRKYGMSIDNLLSVDIVTANGQFLTVSETENPDLFWAIRGGGGNFGIVTSFEYKLQPVGPEVMFLGVMYPQEEAEHILSSWKKYTETAPDEVTTDAFVWYIPDDPGYPEDARDTLVVGVAGIHAGSVAEGEKAFKPLRELGEPVLDISGSMPYVVAQSLFDPLFPEGELHYYWKSVYLDRFDEEVIQTVIKHAAHKPSPRTLISMRHLGGAISRVRPEATAFGDRSAPFLISIDSTWDDPQDTEANITWTRNFWQDLQRFSTGSIYFNFGGLLEENEKLVRASFAENYDRLVALKNKYDPSNLFRLNQNIRPTVGNSNL